MGKMQHEPYNNLREEDIVVPTGRLPFGHHRVTDLLTARDVLETVKRPNAVVGMVAATAVVAAVVLGAVPVETVEVAVWVVSAAVVV